MAFFSTVKARVFVLFFILLSNSVQAQKDQLVIPRDVRSAYEKGTRSPDGQPGANYWQNRAEYDIKAELIPAQRRLRGTQQIIYYNQSPDSLNRLVIRLYQDILKKGNLRDWPVNESDLHNGMVIERLLINGQSFDLSAGNETVTRSGTNLTIKLNQPISPGNQAIVEMDWYFTISRTSNIRMGAYDSTTFFIAYWYPQIAVYDDVNGWDTYNYSGIQEYYNDFNDFQVEITVPKNFMVWATGDLQNVSDVLAPEYVQRYQTGQISDTVLKVISEDDLARGGTTLYKDKLTWIYQAHNVPDFAFGSSDHYLWDMVSLVVDERAPRRVIINAVYNPQSADFYGVADISRKVLEFFSTRMPGVPYPYPVMTVFNGSGGMEFPMIVNNGSQSSFAGTVGLTAHEIAHTYFPFYMGINERKYAWMDEGWAVMLPWEFQSSMVENNDRLATTIVEFNFSSGKEMDLPLLTPSIVYSSHVHYPGYRFNSYTKAAVAYQILRELLGEDLFRQALHEFMRRWNGKHPLPWDFFFTFDAVAGENLSWFWNSWFIEPGYPDLGIGQVKQKSGKSEIEIIRHGNMVIPVQLRVVFDDDSEEIIKKSARVWQNSVERIIVPVKHKKKIKRLELGHIHIPDINRQNNTVTF